MSEVMYVREVANYLGLSETAVRSHVHRKNFDSIPPPIRLGIRLAWLKTDVDAFLQAKASKAKEEAAQELQQRRNLGPGRPRKSIKYSNI